MHSKCSEIYAPLLMILGLDALHHYTTTTTTKPILASNMGLVSTIQCKLELDKVVVGDKKLCRMYGICTKLRNHKNHSHPFLDEECLFVFDGFVFGSLWLV